MPVYEYTALDVNGKSATGIVDAESAPVARQKLRAMQKFPVSINEVADLSKQKTKATPSVASVFYRVKQTDIAAMTRQLATLISAGFPLVSAIGALIPQTASKAFKPILAQIKEAIVEGNSFAGALANYPGVFTSLYTNMVRAGESSGTLEIVLEQLADITEKQQALKTRIQSALAYPILMAGVGILVLFLLITFIVPNITSIFTDMEQVLPLPTIILIDVSNFFKNFWWGVLVVLILIWFCFRSFTKTTTGRHMVDKAKLKLPLFGPIFQKLAVARFTRTLGSLLENGVTLLTSLEIVRNIAGNTQIAMAIEHAADEVSKGQGLGTSLEASAAFPQLSLQMIQVGEQSGELENLLLKIATMYENEVESRVMSVTSLLEPVMILVMGVVLGFVVLSICLPIFEMNQLIM
ncbi:MAG: type II secretion system protein GspF [Deltaproteobacteria bacterium]|nr:MAG: type II secretion system protein GspF [Deltaproteobacteria bacterium]RLC13732.1 MAG: type II secretion system protein GspF [Deltaproteobacteria bacterium]